MGAWIALLFSTSALAARADVYAAALARWDTNGDGALSPAEYEVSGSAADFAATDADADGRVTVDELAAWVRVTEPRPVDREGEVATKGAAPPKGAVPPLGVAPPPPTRSTAALPAVAATGAPTIAAPLSSSGGWTFAAALAVGVAALGTGALLGRRRRRR